MLKEKLNFGKNQAFFNRSSTKLGNLPLEERCRYGFPITEEEKEELQREHIILSRKLLNL